MTRRSPTLRTIAERSGVHVSTVSRILNSRSEARQAASDETIRRVRAIAQELGYRPDPYATSLRTRRSGLIGVLVPKLSDLVLATIYEGIQEAAAQLGLWTFVTNSHDDPDQRAQSAQMMLDRRVDGVIFGDAELDGKFLESFSRHNIPFVLVSRAVPGHPGVTCNDHLGGRLMARHFLERGYERPAVIAGKAISSTGVDRTAGFLAAHAEAGLEIPAHHVVHSTYDAAGGHAAMRRILDRVAPDGVFAVNDFTAIGAMGAMRDAGLVPGRDIGLGGYNDVPLAGELPVGLSTVRSPMHTMGVRAMRLLSDLMAGNGPRNELLEPELVVRESTRVTR